MFFIKLRNPVDLVVIQVTRNEWGINGNPEVSARFLSEMMNPTFKRISSVYRFD